ncbi:MAG TPA: glycine--tRNA ligase subunit beta, partial [Waddliaceae bacterium]
KKGPPMEQAYDKNGELTAAGQGFFRSIGKTPYSAEDICQGKETDVEIKEIKEIPYLFATIRTPGYSTGRLLAKFLPDLILNLDFPKKMRWADLDITYPRPLQWVVALLGKEVIPFTVGNLIAGRESCGHHQLDPTPFEISDSTSYLVKLRKHFVLADRKEREKSIVTQLESLERSLGGQVIAKEQVIPQVLDLTEWPQVTSATFDPAFLKAPKEVLISEMVEHQKYFPVANHQGNLMNLFVITADTAPSDTIRKGNQKVLSSRLKDGVFLYEKGLKLRLEDYDEKLKNVTFLAGFGSLYDKVTRLEKHIEILQKTLNIGTLSKAKRAAKLSKGDLASEMVYEFPDLQGTIGRYYALAQGEDPEVAQAIEEQWMPRGESEPIPLTPTGTLLSLSDKIDNLISCFAAGLKPTSSSDPHALRRQALGAIKMLINGKHRLPFKQIFTECASHFQAKKVDISKLVQDIEDFFVNRIKTVFQDYNFSKDEIEASVANGFTDIYDTFCKVKALHQFRRTSERFPQLYEVYKRAKGQLNNQHSRGITVSLLKEEAEKHLYTTLSSIQIQFNQTLSTHNYDQAYELISQIQPSLATLFDEVKILDDNIELRNNRLALLQEVFTLFSQLLDFSKITEKAF